MSKSVIVAGEQYTKRLRRAVMHECNAWNVDMPSDAQIGAVLHSMANLTDVQAMISFDRMGKAPQGEDPTKETKWWPTETSIGRFFHAAGDAFRSRDK